MKRILHGAKVLLVTAPLLLAACDSGNDLGSGTTEAAPQTQPASGKNSEDAQALFNHFNQYAADSE